MKNILKISLLLLSVNVFAQTAESFDKRINVITPVFNETVEYKIPNNFISNEQKSQDGYLLESYPKNESLEKWTQMITFSAQKNVAMPPEFKLDNVARFFYNNFKASCKDSFSAGKIGDIKDIDGQPNITLVLRCGDLKENDKSYSETVVINFVQGKSDLYTFQYAERKQPLGKLDQSSIDYFGKKNFSLFPINFCQKKMNGEKVIPCSK